MSKVQHTPTPERVREISRMMPNESTALYGFQLWKQVTAQAADELDRLQKAHEALVEALKEIGGEDGYFLAQTATFFGALADHAKTSISENGQQETEKIFEKLHRLSGTLQAALKLAKGEGQ